MAGRVGKWHEIAVTSEVPFGGYSAVEIKRWRELEQKAGRPFGLDDFFRTHGVCISCHGTGVNPFPVAFEGEIGIYTECEDCGATGRKTITD